MKPEDVVQRRRKLEEHMLRGSSGYNTMEWLLPFIFLGGNIRESDRLQAWYKVNGFVFKVERKHFQHTKQAKMEYHDDRVLAFYDLCNAFWDKPIKYTCRIYISNFANIECVLMLRRWGVGGVDNIMEFRNKRIADFVLFMNLKRKRINFHEYYYEKYNRYPTDKAIKTWLWKCCWVESIFQEHLVPQYSDFGNEEQGYLQCFNPNNIGDDGVE